MARFLLTTFLIFMAANSFCTPHDSSPIDTIIVTASFTKDRLVNPWFDALVTRQSKQYIDSMMSVRKTVTGEELKWRRLIASKARLWNSFRDSLSVPFNNIWTPDTVYVLLGYNGVDDGFTFRYNTVCLDVSALQKNYGDAGSEENNIRIDRLFSHEFTHLLHKQWAQQNNLKLKDFRDSILWECLYEGIGMYRSLSPKWFPQNGSLPDLTRNTLAKLYPVFVTKLTTIFSQSTFTAGDRARLNENLSRGPVDKKWGALTVSAWLMQEAKGNDANLKSWIDLGPQGVIKLGRKYLKGNERAEFVRTFGE